MSTVLRTLCKRTRCFQNACAKFQNQKKCSAVTIMRHYNGFGSGADYADNPNAPKVLITGKLYIYNVSMSPNPHNNVKQNSEQLQTNTTKQNKIFNHSTLY